MNKNILIIMGILKDEEWRTRHESICRIYSIQGVSPTLTSGRGGGIEPKILIRNIDNEQKQNSFNRKT